MHFAGLVRDSTVPYGPPYLTDHRVRVKGQGSVTFPAIKTERCPKSWEHHKIQMEFVVPLRITVDEHDVSNVRFETLPA